MDFDDFVGEFDDGGVGFGSEAVEELVEVGVVDGAVVFVADLDEGGSVAGVEALDFVEGEDSIGGGFSEIDAEFSFEVVGDSVGAAHVAGEAGADLDHVFADFVGGVVHGVEGGDAFDFGVGAVEAVGDFGDGGGGEGSSVFALGDPESGEDAGFFVGVVGFEGFELVDGSRGELELEFFWPGGSGALVNGAELDEVAHGD